MRRFIFFAFIVCLIFSGFMVPSVSSQTGIRLDDASKPTLVNPTGTELLYSQVPAGAVHKFPLNNLFRWLFGSSYKSISDINTLNTQGADLSAAGGGAIYIQAGNHIPSSTITYYPNVTYEFDPGAVVDCSLITSGDCSSAIGSLETAVNLSANKTRGDTVISTSTAHGLVAGDIALLKGQRAALHEDGDLGSSKRLGETTAGTTSTFFAEPIIVETKDSATQVTVEKGLMFSDYRTDRALETYVSTRVSTLAKLNLVYGVKIKGGKFILGAGGADTCIRLNYTFEPEVDGTVFDLGTNVGAAIRVSNTLRHDIKNVIAKRTAGWELVAGHESYNSFKDIGAWWGRWNYTDINGCQGLDVVWSSGGHPSIEPYITFKSYDSQECGMTFHSGAFGGTVENSVIHRPKYYGILQRSRFVTLNNIRVVGPLPNAGNSTGILLAGWAVDGAVNNCYIDGGGAQYGIRNLREGGTATGPVNRNTSITNTQIRNCDTAILLANADSSPETVAASGVTIRNLTLSGVKNLGVDIEPYVNYVDIDGVKVDAMSGTAPIAVNSQADAIGTAVRNVSGTDIGAAATLVKVNTITDTTTFPYATYPKARFNIDWKSIILHGTGIHRFESAGSSGGMINIQPSTYTFTLSDADSIVHCSATTDKTWTVPLNASVGFPRNTVITIVQGDDGVVTLAPEGAVVLQSLSGLKTSGKYSVITITKKTADTWVVSSDNLLKAVSTEAELIAAKDFAGQVIVNAPITLTAHLTTTCGLYINRGCPITTTGYTLTINGPFSAGDFQVFSGSGAVTFGSGAVEYLQAAWWADPAKALDCASASGGLKVVLNKVYTTSGVTVKSKCGLIGNNRATCGLTQTAGSTGHLVEIENIGTSHVEEVEIGNLTLTGGSGGGDGIHWETPSSGGLIKSKFHNLTVTGAGAYGIQIAGNDVSGAIWNDWQNVSVENSALTGILVKGVSNENTFINVRSIYNGTNGWSLVLNTISGQQTPTLIGCTAEHNGQSLGSSAYGLYADGMNSIVLINFYGEMNGADDAFASAHIYLKDVTSAEIRGGIFNGSNYAIRLNVAAANVSGASFLNYGTFTNRTAIYRTETAGTSRFNLGMNYYSSTIAHAIYSLAGLYDVMGWDEDISLATSASNRHRFNARAIQGPLLTIRGTQATGASAQTINLQTLKADGTTYQDAFDVTGFTDSPRARVYHALRLSVKAAEPASPTAGDMAYADGTSWNPGGTGAGFYGYTGGAWVKLH
jgi:hypothetical protein